MNLEEALEELDKRTDLGDTIMSNFDHLIEEDIVEQMNETNKADYTAWNFFAKVFKKNDKFYAVIFQYHEPITVVSGSLREIMD